MLTFWDTVRGVQLAETLIRELPKLTAEKTQVIITLLDANADREITEKLAEGYSFKGSYIDSGGFTNIVMEKDR